MASYPAAMAHYKRAGAANSAAGGKLAAGGTSGWAFSGICTAACSAPFGSGAASETGGDGAGISEAGSGFCCGTGRSRGCSTGCVRAVASRSKSAAAATLPRSNRAESSANGRRVTVVVDFAAIMPNAIADQCKAGADKQQHQKPVSQSPGEIPYMVRPASYVMAGAAGAFSDICAEIAGHAADGFVGAGRPEFFQPCETDYAQPPAAYAAGLAPPTPQSQRLFPGGGYQPPHRAAWFFS